MITGPIRQKSFHAPDIRHPDSKFRALEDLARPAHLGIPFPGSYYFLTEDQSRDYETPFYFHL